MMEKGRIEFTDPNFREAIDKVLHLPHDEFMTFVNQKAVAERSAEIEWLQSLLDHIEKGEIELVKESVRGAIEILGRKQ